jgi:hypothetical protein
VGSFSTIAPEIDKEQNNINNNSRPNSETILSSSTHASASDGFLLLPRFVRASFLITHLRDPRPLLTGTDD